MRLTPRLLADAQELAPWAKVLKKADAQELAPWAKVLQKAQALEHSALIRKHGSAGNRVRGSRPDRASSADRLCILSECLVLTAVTKTAEVLFEDVIVRLLDGTGRQGAVRSVVMDKYFIVQIGVLLVFFTPASQPRTRL